MTGRGGIVRLGERWRKSQAVDRRDVRLAQRERRLPGLHHVASRVTSRPNAGTTIPRRDHRMLGTSNVSIDSRTHRYQVPGPPILAVRGGAGPLGLMTKPPSTC